MNRAPAHNPSTQKSRQREVALARWDNEGGALPQRRPSDNTLPERPQRGTAELVQLRIRVIALENLVITLLAESSDRQLDLARAMATHVAPRSGFTHHRITLHAAAQMLHLVKRAGHFQPATFRIENPPDAISTRVSSHSAR